MARKRDYKAEYARRKRLATQSGYKSVREYRKVRKELKIPRNASPVPRQVLSINTDKTVLQSAHMRGLRAACKRWSDAHSRRRNSRYRDTFTDSQVERYYAAFVEKIDYGTQRKTDFVKRMRIKKFLMPEILATEAEWKANPSTVPLRR